MNNKNTLYIIRGISGCGKSTLAKFLVENFKLKAVFFEADKWMEDDCGNYEFNVTKLGYCHNKCREAVEIALADNTPVVIVSNTNTSEKEINPYIELGNKYNYDIVSLVIENRHGNSSVHGVPLATLERQENSIKASLKLR